MELRLDSDYFAWNWGTQELRFNRRRRVASHRIAHDQNEKSRGLHNVLISCRKLRQTTNRHNAGSVDETSLPALAVLLQRHHSPLLLRSRLLQSPRPSQRSTRCRSPRRHLGPSTSITICDSVHSHGTNAAQPTAKLLPHARRRPHAQGIHRLDPAQTRR